jgi:hypothetical protein
VGAFVKQIRDRIYLWRCRRIGRKLTKRIEATMEKMKRIERKKRLSSLVKMEVLKEKMRRRCGGR